MDVLLMGILHKDGRVRTFDWIEAHKLIKERRPKKVEAYLEKDYYWTAGTIYEDGVFVADNNGFLSSNWAIPTINIDGEVLDCWVWLDEFPKYTHQWPTELIDTEVVEL